MELTFKSKNPKQIEAAEAWLDSNIEEILYGGAKGGGKSYLGSSLIFGDALIYPGTHYYIARKELNDLRKFTIPSIHEVFRNWRLDIEKYAPFNGQDNIFNLYNGSKVYLVSCSVVPSDPLFERFGSMQMTRGWIEEAGEVEEAAKANLWLATGRWLNEEYGLKKKQLLSANPKKGYLKRDFVDPFLKGVLPRSRKYIQALPTDNPYLSSDYIDSLRNERDPVRRQRLFEGNWDYDESKDSLISYDALSDMFSNTITLDGNRYLIVDVARLGKDRTVVALYEGLKLIKIWVFEKQATNVTIQKIKDLAAAERVPYSHILVDEDGIGGAVVDGLQGVRGFIANSNPMPTGSEVRMRQSKVDNHFIPKRNFKNLKAQCGFKLAELINEHKIAADVPEYRDVITEELTAILRQKDVDSDGKLQLRPKDEVKIELGRSPDVGDTFLMRVWFELKKEALNEDPNMGAIIERQNMNFNKNRFSQAQNSTE